MKILFLNSFSEIQGGAERLLYDTVIGLVNRGDKCCIIFANDDRKFCLCKTEWPSVVKKYYLPDLKVPMTNKTDFTHYKNQSKYKKELRYFQDILSIENPDLIHVHNFPNIEFLKSCTINIPLLKTVHSYENLCETRMKILPNGKICYNKMTKNCSYLCNVEDSYYSIRVRAENRLLKKSFQKIIAVSEWIKSVLVCNGFHKKQVIVLNNFTRPIQVPENYIEKHQVAFIGRLTPEKGPVELIEIISKIPSSPTLVMVGGMGMHQPYGYEQKLIQLAEQLNVRLSLTPWKTGQELAKIIAESKIIAFPAIWPEPFGLVGIECMMLGKPIVGFDTGGVGEWLMDGKGGFLVPPGRKDIFAHKLDQLLSDKDKRIKMGEYNQLFARISFSPETHLTKLRQIYQEMIHESITH